MEFDEQPQEFNVDFGEVTRSGGGGGAVNSVNGKTGDVVLDAEDVGALPNSTVIPTKTSELENDGATGDSSYVETGELASVATSGKYTDLTDTPTIPSTASDVGALPDSTKYGKSISASGTTLTLKDQDGEDLATATTQDTTYSNFTGTDGQTAGAAGLVPAPATTDAGKFLKADGTWDTAGGGGGDSVYSTKTTSNSATGGAVYIGNKGTDQVPVLDPSPNDNHFKYFWALPYSNNGNTYGQPGNGSVNIMGSAKGINTVAIGASAGAGAYGASYAVMIGAGADAGPSGISIGDNAGTNQDYNGVVCIGSNSTAGYGAHYSVALGHGARPDRKGEVNVGATGTNGFNNTTYRVIGGVHDGQDAHDAMTVGQANALIDAINTALNTNIAHIGS